MSVLRSTEDFRTFTILLEKAGTADFLASGGPYTVLAPNEKAFNRISKRQILNLARNKDQLQKFLAYHVIAGKVMKADLKPGNLKTMQGRDLIVKVEPGKIAFNRAKIVKADVAASNGVIHVIDVPLFPMTGTTSTAPKGGSTPTGGSSPTP